MHRLALHPLKPSWNLEVLIFAEGGKTGEPREKPLKQGREPTNNSNDHQSRNRTRDHRGEVRAPTATPPMLPMVFYFMPLVHISAIK
jgi:hypothetical protein